MLEKKMVRLTRSDKRIELINWVLVNMKNPDIFMCEVIESKINEIIVLLVFHNGQCSDCFLL